MLNPSSNIIVNFPKLIGKRVKSDFEREGDTVDTFQGEILMITYDQELSDFVFLVLWDDGDLSGRAATDCTLLKNP